jgi:hypothetical protein
MGPPPDFIVFANLSFYSRTPLSSHVIPKFNGCQKTFQRDKKEAQRGKYHETLQQPQGLN